MSKVYTIGEALIDFIPDRKGVSLKNVNSFQKAPGGAPANVACAVARLGGNSSFIGKLGIDAFGDFLLDTLNDCGVDVSCVTRSDEANTALAFVSLNQDGNRNFMFYRNPSADMLLSEGDIKNEWFSKGDILHFCSVDLIEAPVKYAHIKAIKSVKDNCGIISFDPNVRLFLWNDIEKCRNTIKDFIPSCDILKISDEELGFITSIDDKAAAIKSLFMGDVKIVICTNGPDGADLYTKDFSISIKGIKVNVVDTTGAGDAFIGSFLFKIAAECVDIRKISKDRALDILKFANAYAAVSTTRKGAISALPSIEEVNVYL